MESDLHFFDRRSPAAARIRSPFPGELQGLDLDVPPRHDVLIVVKVCRDQRTGSLVRARAVFFVPLLSLARH